MSARIASYRHATPAKLTPTAPPPSHEVGLAGEHYVAVRLAMVGITPYLALSAPKIGC